ncbi:hypothetical protein LEP1GSC172_2387 [Leptospira noguchii]|uniref:Uncharacterized protein n=2 Tax=Leptospira noguchii TaxID=28182 RepID=T0GU71_9LEPT|nr:hypothetical protein LEP1GSC172_2387 [Leptospira noguchii]EQA72472.1 hypothetical protein LEP1GSC059_3248 [Leptospira noguchii serovar Panama str. CZ214]
MKWIFQGILCFGHARTFQWNKINPVFKERILGKVKFESDARRETIL